MLLLIVLLNMAFAGGAGYYLVRIEDYRAQDRTALLALLEKCTLHTVPLEALPAYLRNKEKDLMDPWGMLYRCFTDVDERGAVRFYVWTERQVAGKVRKIGFPPPEKKK